MEQEKNKNGVIALLVVLVVILAVLCVLFATGTISLKSKGDDNGNNQTSNTETNEQVENNNSKYTINSVTSAKVDLFWNNENYDINVVDGKLKVNDKTFSNSNENIKYFYFQRYQSSRSTVFHYLTENGNVYVTEFTTENGVESFNNFKKLNYSNVTDIVVLPNDHYGKTYDEVSGMVDHRETYLYALINGETFKLDYQYNY